MVQRWVQAIPGNGEKRPSHYGYKDLWALKAILDPTVEKDVASNEKVACS